MAPDHGVKGGLMAAVGLSAEAAETRLKHAGLTRSVVGCDNSATGVTLAGLTASLCLSVGAGAVAERGSAMLAMCALDFRLSPILC